MNKKIFALGLTALMALTSVVPAMAQGVVEVTGGALTIAATQITMTPVTLDGSDQNVGGTTEPWAAADLRGTGAGWHVLIDATQFTNGTGGTIDVEGFAITLLDTAIVTVDGNTKPVSARPTATALGASQLLTNAAADTGMGSYTMQPTFTLAVPADTYAGTYSSTVNVTAVTGP